MFYLYNPLTIVKTGGALLEAPRDASSAELLGDLGATVEGHAEGQASVFVERKVGAVGGRSAKVQALGDAGK